MAEKKFNTKLYGIFAIIAVATVLVTLTVTTYVSRYNGFHAEKVAQAYVSTIVETGDGYNALKNSLLSMDQKFGDYIRVNYLNPVIYEGYKPGDATKGLKGLNDESRKGEKTLHDDGTLEGQLIEKMYPVYTQLLETNGGWDACDAILTGYIAALRTERAALYGDDFFDDEVFFTTLEANIAAYGDTLTGTEDAFDKNTGVQTSFASEGAYQKKYGDDYKFTVEPTAERAGVSAFEGSPECKVVTVQVRCGDTVVVDGVDVTLVRVGRTWYVDQNACDTAALYTFYR
ncbi:MAG: hypothetical protein IKD72_05025 [Clostridia bacterium]|nr:hypothetical protein [Clostridia bacterium]